MGSVSCGTRAYRVPVLLGIGFPLLCHVLERVEYSDCTAQYDEALQGGASVTCCSFQDLRRPSRVQVSELR